MKVIKIKQMRNEILKPLILLFELINRKLTLIAYGLIFTKEKNLSRIQHWRVESHDSVANEKEKNVQLIVIHKILDLQASKVELKLRVLGL